MKPIDNFYFDFFQSNYRIIAAFLMAIALNAFAIPKIILIAKSKKLFDVPNSRTSHSSAVPTLGGLGIFFSITMVSLLLINTSDLNGRDVNSSLFSLPAIIAGLTLIFFVGMADDLMNIPAWKKLIAEVLALLILTVIGNIRLSSLQGMFGIGELNYTVSLVISIFSGIVIINSINLIDGVDGLASLITMLGSFIFGAYFIQIHEWEYVVFAATIFGSLIPFFIYNTFGKKNKIFMGDTGSLILGFVLTILVFGFNSMNSTHSIKPFFIAGPAFSFAILIVPMFDTLRVMTIRLIRGGNPFTADRRHIHHILLDLGFTHLQTTLMLNFVNLMFIVFAYYFNFLGNSSLLFFMLAAASIMSAITMMLFLRKMELQKANIIPMYKPMLKISINNFRNNSNPRQNKRGDSKQVAS